MRELILGGARSGKSRLAEERAAGTGHSVCYIATATAGDGEMAARIRRHRERRPAAWTTIESPRDLAGAVNGAAAPGRCVLIDCLTLWLANCLAGEEGEWPRARAAFLEAVAAAPGQLVFVANEVGLGIVPDNALARRFRDEAGQLNQAVAGACERVTFVAAGMPLVLKQPEPDAPP